MLLWNGIMMRMKSTMIYKKWDIILVPFPFTDLSSSKRRPGLIISPNEYNSEQDVVILFVTSKVDRQKRVGDYLVSKWKESGFPKPSMVRMKFATIDKSIIVKKIGSLSKIDYENLSDEIRSFFDA